MVSLNNTLKKEREREKTEDSAVWGYNAVSLDNVV
jgi:hypothetical protein